MMNTAIISGARTCPSAGWLFVLCWTLVSVVGFAVQGWVFHYPGDLYTNMDLFVPFALPFDLFPYFPAAFSIEAALFGVILATLTGALLAGLPQWLLLRRHLALSVWWIAAVALSIGLTHGLVDGSSSWPLFLPLIMLASGTVLGVSQWLATRRQVARAIGWIPVSALGWYLAWLLGALALNASGLLGQEWTPVIGSQQHGLFSAVFGLVYGALSGGFWLYLLRRKGDAA
jgi:hypothetical protein